MKPTIVFVTDCGAGGGEAMTGVVKSVDPDLSVYDFNHDVEPYNILDNYDGDEPHGLLPGYGT